MIKKCDFCGRLFEVSEGAINSGACPLCQAAAKRNDFPGSLPPTKPKKNLNEDGFFDKNEYNINEDKGSEFFESSDYYNC